MGNNSKPGWLSSESAKFVIQLAQFGIVGISNVLLDLLIYFLLTRYGGLHYLLAASIAIIMVASWSFWLNSKWTFRKQKTDKCLRTKYLQFVSVYVGVIALNALALYLFVDVIGLYDLWGKLLSSMIVGTLNFCVNKFWTFGGSKVGRAG